MANTLRAQPKVITIVSLTVIAVALVGLVVGFGHPAPGWSGIYQAPPEYPAGVQPAVPYLEMDGKMRGPNREYQTRLANLMVPKADIMEQIITDPELRAQAITKRAARRAYSGAPPSIPHPVDGNDVSSCYLCHGEGKVIGTVIAPKISHQRYTNCTQCHAQGNTPTPGDDNAIKVENQFAGTVSAGKGTRAYVGAPPTIPHPTHMRENCTSCHGQLGLAGMKTPHAWRVNCQQCHTPGAGLDQHRFEDPSPPPWSGETQGK
ncbi:MAG: diheme cytochrome c precursor [Planctomycetota bacterium]